MEKSAKTIRIITIPTLVLLTVILISQFAVNTVFTGTKELLITISFLIVVPIIAYPISHLLSKNKDKDYERKLQRKLAFVFSLVGYSIYFLLSYLLAFNTNLMMMSYTYFLTIIILSIVNIFIKASGHAAGIVGPMLLLCHYIGWIFVIPCVVVYALSFWASIYLKRHTILQFILGTIIAAVAFVIPLLIFYI